MMYHSPTPKTCPQHGREETTTSDFARSHAIVPKQEAAVILVAVSACSFLILAAFSPIVWRIGACSLSILAAAFLAV